MESKTLKLLFDNGGLERARIEPFPMTEDTWTLSVVLTSGEEKPVTRVRTNKTKVYKSLTAVLTDVRKIGFNHAEVYL